MNKMLFLTFSLVTGSATAGTFPFSGFYGTYALTSCEDKGSASEYCKFNTLTLKHSGGTRNGSPEVAMDIVMTDNKQNAPGARSTHTILHPDDMRGGTGTYSESKDKASYYFKTLKMQDGSYEVSEMDMLREENGVVRFTSKKTITPENGPDRGTNTVMTLTKKK